VRPVNLIVVRVRFHPSHHADFVGTRTHENGGAVALP
jgi:hypothetical protein